MWSPAKSKEAALFLNFVSRENKEVNKDIEVLTKEVQIEENKPNKINKPIDTTSKSKKEKQSSSNINNFFSKELQKEVEIEDPAMKSFFDHHKMHMKQSIQTEEDVDNNDTDVSDPEVDSLFKN